MASSDATVSPSAAATSSFLLDTMLPLCFKLGAVVAGLVSIVAGLLYVKQDSLLYFPEIGGIPRRPSKNPRGYRNPKEHNVDFEDCRIPCSDGVVIHAWLLWSSNNPPTSTPTILFFHGNAGNIGLRLPNAVQLVRATGANVLLVEYRGYGDSDSVSPNEAGLQLDAIAALEFCRNHTKLGPQLFVFGRSLGGAVAFYLADHAQRENRPLAGVMVENTFTSIADMVDHLMPLVSPFKALVLRISWDSTRHVRNLKGPILFLAGSADELVPPSHTSRLIELAQTSSPHVSLHVIPGGTHNECWIQGGEAYWKAIATFLRDPTGTSSSTVPSPSVSTTASQPFSESLKKEL